MKTRSFDGTASYKNVSKTSEKMQDLDRDF